MDRFLPLAKPPTFFWRKTPPLPDHLRTDYQKRKQELEEHPYLFNGRVTATFGFSNGGLIVTPIDYAMAGLISAGKVEGMAVIGVRGVIVNSLGQMLWPLRGPKTVFAGYWEPGAGGAIDQANSERVMVAELREELGIDVATLAPGALRFEGVGESDHLTRLVWSVAADQFKANPDEVSEAIWLATDQRPEPILPHYGPRLLDSLGEIASKRGART